MQSSINKKVDLCWVLSFVAEQSNALSGEAMHAALQDGTDAPLLGGGNGVNISFIAGTINNDENMRMARMLFRATRGKALTHFSEPFTQDGKSKIVYMVVFQDGQVIRNSVTKIADSFMGSRFDI